MSGSNACFVSSNSVAVVFLLVCLKMFFLITRNKVLRRRKCCKWAFSHMMVWGKGKHSTGPWSSLSLLLSLCLWTVNFTSIAQFFFSLLKWESITRVCWSLVFPFSEVSWALVIPQRVRVCLASFPCRLDLLKRTKCSGMFQNGSFSPPPARSLRVFFSDNYCGNLVKLLEGSLTRRWGPPYD